MVDLAETEELPSMAEVSGHREGVLVGPAVSDTIVAGPFRYLRTGAVMSDEDRLKHIEGRLTVVENFCTEHKAVSEERWAYDKNWKKWHDEDDRIIRRDTTNRFDEHTRRINDLRVLVAKYVGAGVVIGSLLGALSSMLIDHLISK